MDTFALYTLGVVSFVIAILISIGLHELGHMIPAKRFGAKVTQYFIGFGPTVWSKKRGETEYGIKAIPLGGFVRIIGMMPPVKGHFDLKAEPELDENGEVKERLLMRDSNTGMFTSLISSAKKAEYETIDKADEHRLFYRIAWWKKLIVMAGGPTVNLIIAFFCFLSIFAFWGVDSVSPTKGAPVLSTVVKCAVPPYGESPETCAEADQSPAYRAGLKPGDRVVGLNGEPVTSWNSLTEATQRMGGEEIMLTVERDGKSMDIAVTPVVLQRPDEDSNGKTIEVGFMGVAPTFEMVNEKHGAVYTLDYMGEKTIETFEAFAQIPSKVKNVVLAIVGVEERDPNGPVSIVGGARFTGEVASYDGQIEGLEITFSDKVKSFLLLVASFNLFIGLFNFLPILPLDGGHILGALIEGVKTGFAKLFGLPKPKPFDIGKLLPIAYGFGVIMFLLGMILIVGDLVVPIKLFG